jgi:integrase
LTRQEVDMIFAQMSGIYGLIARLLYGTGMRLMECAQLRVKDVDFQRREILVREGKGSRVRCRRQGLGFMA